MTTPNRESPIPPTIPRVALVTGAGQRLGRAIALALAETGFDVGVHCNASVEAAEATAASVRERARRGVVLRADLSREDQTEALLGAARAVLGPVGVLVNNAALFERDEWDSATRQSWDRHMETNLRAPFVLIQHFARGLPEGAEGVVVNMVDQRVLSITPHFVTYTVAKAGLWALTQSMALALAPRIRVNAIGPGPTLPSPRQSEAQFARQSASVPLGHGASPDEIARAVIAILTLPAMTGQMLALDGGQHLQWASSQKVASPEE
ncbi:MAG: SDR family oxidoreductase [Acetobacteraceae bacterium]